MALLVVGN